MGRPADGAPVWAQDLTFTSGPDTGFETKDPPSTGFRDQGWLRDDPVLAQYLNYWQNLVGLWVEYFDGHVYEWSDLPTLDIGQTTGTKIYTSQEGWYEFSEAIIYTEDEFWAVDSDVVTGQWIRAGAASVSTRHVAIGPTANDAFTAATPAGRINKDLIDHGFFTNDAGLTPVQYTGITSATVITVATLSTLSPDLAVNDLVNFTACARARGNDAAAFNFKVFLEWSEDNGSTWASVTSSTADYRAGANNESQGIPLNFFKLSTTADTHIIRLRAHSDGANELIIDIDSWYCEVTRA